MGEGKHSEIGASGASRWIPCPGSVKASGGLPDSSSDAAMLGTAAHELGEKSILKGLDVPDPTIKNIIVAGKEFEVDENMYDAVKVYTKYAKGLQQDKGEVAVEQRFHLPQIHENMFGTGDLIVHTPFTRLNVVDYKHGEGVVVEIVYDAEPDRVMDYGDFEEAVYSVPKDLTKLNPQLMIYLLGAFYEAGGMVPSLVLTVVQPRAIHDHAQVRSVVMTPETLYRWRDEILIPAVKRVYSDNPTFAAGSWCRFCKAKAVCPKRLQYAGELARLAFNPIIETKKELTFPLPQDLTPLQLGRIHEFASAFSDWADGVKSYMKDQLATGNIKSVDLGYKRVAGNQRREWKDIPHNIAQELLRTTGPVARSEFDVTPKFKSPAQIEKFLVEKGTTKKDAKIIVEGLVKKIPGNPKLVLLKSKGVELLPDAENAFKDLITKE